MRLGDLVKSKKHPDTIGIVTEIFDDINEDNPWVKVVFTGAAKSSQWFKKDSLIVINKKEEEDKKPLPLSGVTSESGSL